MLTDIKTERIYFAFTRPEDVDFVMTLEQDSYNKRFVFSWTRQEHLAAIADPNRLHLVIRDLEDQPVGYMILAGADSADRSLEFMRMVIVPKGRGYGRQAVRLLKLLAFKNLNFHRLWLDVYEDNLPAIKLYLDEGFVQEGLLRECKRSDQGYRSMILMSMLEQEYFA